MLKCLNWILSFYNIKEFPLNLMHVCKIDRLLYAEEKILPKFKDVLNHLRGILFDLEDMEHFLVDSLDDQSHVAFETLGVGGLALAVDSFADEYTVVSACLIDA